MPLRCFDPAANTSVHAFDLSQEDWRALELRNRNSRHLAMPCCSSRVTLRVSRRGTRFFAHKAVGACSTAPETEAHLRLKRMAVEAARANGWSAETEVAGTAASGEQWRADVLARKDGRAAAVEIQWSGQTVEETRRRQARYAQSAVRCLWLLRKGGCPTDRAVPAAGIGGTLDAGFTALVPNGSGAQEVPMREFLDAAFGGRLRFGLPLGVAAGVSVRAGRLDCWSCGAETRIVTGIDVDVGPNAYGFSVPDLGDHPDLFEIISRHLPSSLGLGPVERRFSKTQGRSYLSNGCANCGALIGEFFEHDAWEDQAEVCRFSVRIDERWRRAIRGNDGYEEGWGVYPPA